jgi:hypothetical protein
MILMIETRIEPMMAEKKLSTSNPDTRYATTENRAALMTIINNPRVRIVIGIVKIISSGLTSAFKMPRIIAATIADCKSTIVMPG